MITDADRDALALSTRRTQAEVAKLEADGVDVLLRRGMPRMSMREAFCGVGPDAQLM